MIKIKNLWKKYNIPIVSFCCSIVVISVIYYLCKVSPFGDNSLLAIDFYHQYGPMMGELYDRIKNGSNIIYSFNMGTGLPFFKNYFNYMSSFFNILLFLFKRSDLLTSYSFIIGLKSAVSALTMSIFLKNKLTKFKDIIPCFALIYAFNNYFVAYYWNIMWIDGLVYLPLIILGIEHIVNDNKCLLYIISLGLMLFSNYFIGYMICIFSVFYFLIYYFFISENKNKRIINIFIRFFISSLLAGGIAAICLIPIFTSLNTISATNDVWPTSQYYSFTITEFIFNHLSGVSTTVLKSDLINAPNISSSIITLPFLILFFINKKVSIKQKVGFLLLLIILISSFFYASFDFIWHAFHVPNDLPYRYSFLYPFLMLCISCYSLNKIDVIKDWFVLLLYILSMLFAGSAFFLSSFNIDDKIVLLNLIVLSIWFLFYIIYKFFNKKTKIIPVLAVASVIIECIFGLYYNWDINQSINTFYKSYDIVESSIDFIKTNDTDKFYRIEKKDFNTLNDPSWFNYFGITTFSSMEYENLAVLNKKLGNKGNNINSFSLYDNTPIYNMMFNLKYMIGELDDNNYSLYYSDAINNNYVYKSNYSTSIMYRVNPEIIYWNYISDNPFIVQNDFITTSTGIDNTFNKVEPINDIMIDGDNGIVHKYKYNNANGYIYLNSAINSIIINGRLFYNDSEVPIIDSSYDYISSNSLNDHHIIKVNDTDIIYVAFNEGYEQELLFYTIDKYSLDYSFKIINENSVIISNFSENKIEGSYSGDNGVIYTSIPYDIGWKVYIDNKKVDTFMIGNALLGFNIDDGDHIIVLKYEIPYFKTSLFLSSFSIIIVIYLYKRKLI